jgi:hypothetical protein
MLRRRFKSRKKFLPVNNIWLLQGTPDRPRTRDSKSPISGTRRTVALDPFHIPRQLREEIWEGIRLPIRYWGCLDHQFRFLWTQS